VTETLPRILTVQKFARALIDAGIIPSDASVTRLVIDVDVDKSAVVMHIQRWADERLLQVVAALEGVEIREVNRNQQEEQAPAEAGQPTEEA
jgi:ribosomal protein L12E/L44/L45/RPP1/RPP2